MRADQPTAVAPAAPLSPRARRTAAVLSLAHLQELHSRFLDELTNPLLLRMAAQRCAADNNVPALVGMDPGLIGSFLHPRRGA